MPTEPPKDESRARVKQAVEAELAAVKSPEQADAVLQQLKSIPPTQKAVEVSEAAAQAPESAAEAVEQAAATPGPKSEKTAAVLATAAAQGGAETPESGAVAVGAQEAVGSKTAQVTEDAKRGRKLLQEATLRDLNPIEAIDAQAFLVINNGLPRPEWAEKAANLISVAFHGGWIWGLAVFLDHGLSFGNRERRILRVLLPTLGALNWIVEHPIKTYFRRERPFIDVVRAMVIGKKPGSWSFPSGHTASSFAAAWILGAIWPKRASAFFSIASFVGFTRVYVGVHYPGDVLSGAVTGVVLGEVLRRLTRRLFL